MRPSLRQIRSELPKLCPGVPKSQLEAAQRAVLEALDEPRPLDGYFGTLRSVRAGEDLAPLASRREWMETLA